MMEQRLIPPYPFWAHAIAVSSSPPKTTQSAGAGPPLGRGGHACPALRLQCARSAIAGQAHSKRTHNNTRAIHVAITCVTGNGATVTTSDQQQDGANNMDRSELLYQAGSSALCRMDDGETIEQAVEAVAPDFPDITPAEIIAWLRGF